MMLYGYNDKGRVCVTGKGGAPLTEQEVSELKKNPVYRRYQYRPVPKAVTAADLPEVRDAQVDPVRDELVETEITNKSETDGNSKSKGGRRRKTDRKTG